MLEGKIAFVTGARGGIGRAIVARFIREGATVYAADLTPEGSLATHDEDGSHFVKLDLTREADAIAAMESVKAQAGKLDVLVNAAGRSKRPLKRPRSKSGTAPSPSTSPVRF